MNGVLAPSQFDAYHPTAAGYSEGYLPLVLAEMEQLRPSVSQRGGR